MNIEQAGIPEVFPELQKRSILQSSDINRLKQYIFNKYHNDPAVNRSQILAQALNDILNRELRFFDHTKRERIRQEAIKQAVQLPEFQIRASNIFMSAILAEAQEATPDYAALSRWMSQQAINLSEADIHTIVWKIQTEKVSNFEELMESYVSPTGIQPTSQTVPLDPHHSAVQTDKDSAIVFAESNRLKPNTFNTFVKLQLDRCYKFVNKQIPKLSEHLPIASQNFWEKLKKSLPLSGDLPRKALLALPLAVLLLMPLLSENLLVFHRADLAANTYNNSNLTASSPLPPELRYQEVDQEALLTFLRAYDSLLAEEPYFSTILDACRKNDINPHLLFAITGQEQAFVPRSTANARLIANNPFNVYTSWQDYNTNINDTTQIACQTILALSKNRPAEADSLQWINRAYAQDPNWSAGVNYFLTELSEK